MFCQILLSPQEKRYAIMTYKHGLYEFPNELPNNLILRILANFKHDTTDALIGMDSSEFPIILWKQLFLFHPLFRPTPAVPPPYPPAPVDPPRQPALNPLI